MTTAKVVSSVRYVTDAQGQKTDVVVPLATWKALLVSWKQLAELAEDRQDILILREWLEKRAAGEAEMIPLEALEQELVADGLL